MVDAGTTRRFMNWFDRRRPRDAEAFARMLANAAAAIDRAEAGQAAGGRGTAALALPPQPAAGAGAETGRRRDRGPEASAVWPEAARAAGKKPAEAGEPTNPYDLLKQASRAQERAAAQLLATRAKPPRK